MKNTDFTDDKIDSTKEAINKFAEYLEAVKLVNRLSKDPDISKLIEFYASNNSETHSTSIRESSITGLDDGIDTSDKKELTEIIEPKQRVLNNKRKEKRERLLNIYDNIIKRGFTIDTMNDEFDNMYHDTTNQKGIVLRLINEGVLVEVRYSARKIYYARKEHVTENGFKDGYEPKDFKQIGEPQINTKVNLGKN